MCRLFGVAATAPVDVSFELLEAANPIIQQSESHDSGWGVAFYENGALGIERFAHAAHADPEFPQAARAEARLMMVHVRRATFGGLKLENTHPFSRAPYSYCHNGTILQPSNLLELSDREPAGETDSEHFFNLLMTLLDPADVVGSLRRTVETVCDRCRFSALNFLFCDGHSLYAYRLGLYELYWLARNLDLEADTRTHYHLHLERPHGEHVALVSSEKLTDDEPWGEFGQDQLLICDPAEPDHPRIERLLGERAAGVEFVPLDHRDHLSGAERGEWAARRAVIDA
jgi:prepilin-type processing-associated H-X9-DG protein